MTLIEIMVAVAILGIILAIGGGVLLYAGRSQQLPVAVAQVKAVLRRAYNSARQEGEGAYVEFSPDGRGVMARARRPVAAWPFEPGDFSEDPIRGEVLVRGALGLDLVSRGPRAPVRSWLGHGLFLEPALPGAESGAPHLVLERPDARFTPEGGLAVDVWLRPMAPAPGPPSAEGPLLHYVVQREGPSGPSGPPTCYLRLTDALEVQAGVLLEGPGGEVLLEASTLPRVLGEAAWSHVSAVCAQGRLSILVNGYERATTTASVEAPAADVGPGEGAPDAPEWRLARSGGPLYVGHPREPFQGGVDELRFSAVESSEPYLLPTSCLLVAPPPAVRFSGRGQLDPMAHVGPVRLVLTDLDPDSLEGIRATLEGQTRTVEPGEDQPRELSDAIPADRKATIVVEPSGFVR
ncbi:MAG: prepilin-type N-terminal cleavage/methylation domain-containing protein [Planctomycetes bacterium]|nr:prepilin-type N-terminal cleavage/methylation domain-containing protein [Planctomycetota bacterium]